MSVSKVLNYNAELTHVVDNRVYPVPLIVSEADAHTVNVAVTENGVPVSGANIQVFAKFLRADANTVPINGTFDNGVASVTLPGACYAADGAFKLTMYLRDGDTNSAILALVGRVSRMDSDAVVDPGELVPDITTLLAKIAEMEQATEDARRATYDAAMASQGVLTFLAFSEFEASTTVLPHETIKYARAKSPIVLYDDTEVTIADGYKLLYSVDPQAVVPSISAWESGTIVIPAGEIGRLCITTAAQPADLDTQDKVDAAARKVTLETKAAKRLTGLEATTKNLYAAIDNRIKKFYTANAGETYLPDSDDGSIRNVKMYGKSTQDGVPAPDAPVEIHGVERLEVSVYGKNLYGRTLEQIKQHNTPDITHGVWDGNIFTRNGITFTVNDDGTITVSGTPSASTQFFIKSRDIYGLDLPNGKYKLYGGTSTCGVNISKTVNGTSAFAAQSKSNDGVEFAYDNIYNGYGYYLQVSTSHSGTTVIRPMICSANTTDNAYAPYTPPVTRTIVPPFPLNGMGEMKDVCDVERGVYEYNIRHLTAADYAHSIAAEAEYFLASDVELIPTEDLVFLRELSTMYHDTNVIVTDQDGNTVDTDFLYPCSVAGFVEYVKAQTGDTRAFIYDLDDRVTDADYAAAAAFVNAEYAAALAELNY